MRWPPNPLTCAASAKRAHRRRRLRPLGWLLCALPWLNPAAAQPCPDGSQPPDEDLVRYERRLAALAPRCADDAGFLAWQGAVLLRLGRARQAAVALERALLLAPDHQGARLDYALALAALGEPAAASELAGQVAARPDAPPAVRDTLAHFALPPLDWRQQGRLGLLFGHDSNLNRATRATNLVLSLPGGVLDLPLNPAARAQGGFFWRLEGEGALTRPLAADAALAFSVRINARATPGQDYGSEELDLSFAYRRRDADGEWWWPAGASLFRWRGETLQTGLRAGGMRLFSDAPCRPAAGLLVEARRHPAAPTLDHRLDAASFGWLCEGAAPWMLTATVGREDAPRRPGGDAVRGWLRYLGAWPAQSGQLELEARLGIRRDAQGYSPWLAEGAALRSRSQFLRLQWRRPLGAGWALTLGGEAERETANLPLFSVARRQLQAGLARQW